MPFKITDSESIGKPLADGIGNNSSEVVRFRRVANRDEALGDYIRVRIREWRASGRQLQELARKAGIAKSSPSTVLLGVGVGRKTGEGYARAFGFRSYRELQLAAHDWWGKQGEAVANAVETPPEPAIAEAIEVLKVTLRASEAQLRTILVDFSAPRFRGRDTMWWVTTLGHELKLDHDALAKEKAEQRAVARERAVTSGKTRQAFKEAGAVKKRAREPQKNPEQERGAALVEPPRKQREEAPRKTRPG